MKKKIVSLCLVMALLAISAVGMYAYFTDTKEVNNTFSFSNDVTITLDEAKVDADGVATTDPRVTSNTYENVYPGQTVDKDPTVHVDDNSAECYVRAFVTINEKADLDKIFKDHSLALTDVILGNVPADWAYVENKVDGDKRVYEFRYTEALGAGENSTAIFTNVKFPAFLTEDEMGTIAGLKIDVKAEAVQTAGFDTYTAAWTAIDAE